MYTFGKKKKKKKTFECKMRIYESGGDRDAKKKIQQAGGKNKNMAYHNRSYGEEEYAIVERRCVVVHS